jgi:hypothetical protein
MLKADISLIFLGEIRKGKIEKEKGKKWGC